MRNSDRLSVLVCEREKKRVCVSWTTVQKQFRNKPRNVSASGESKP